MPQDNFQAKAQHSVDGFLDSTQEEILISLEEMVAETEPEDCYEGPSAFTARELGTAWNVDREAARKRAQRQVRLGNWIEVQIKSNIPGHRLLCAWVKKEIYEEWERTLVEKD